MNALIAQLDRQKHKTTLLSILLDFSRNQLLSSTLVFKGWTALYLLYGLDRFSTDLDFDLIPGRSSDKKILSAIESVLLNYGDIKDLRIKAHTIFWLISYGKIDHNIKIEINRRWPTGNYQLKNFLGIPLFVMNIEDMSANKLLALIQRTQLANRDIYDIHFILRNRLPINQQRIEEVTHSSFVSYIQKCIQFLEKLGDKHNILDGLGTTLDPAKKPDVKKNLLRETIFLLHGLL